LRGSYIQQKECAKDKEGNRAFHALEESISCAAAGVFLLYFFIYE
jgi:hypothetical protein